MCNTVQLQQIMGSADRIRGYDEIIGKETDSLLKHVELYMQSVEVFFFF
jgi:hypothetical protein